MLRFGKGYCGKSNDRGFWKSLRHASEGCGSRKYIKSSAESLARLLKVQEKEILFTSGGTESDNLALIGATFANKRSGNHIITTSVEHPAVSQPALSFRNRALR